MKKIGSVIVTTFILLGIIASGIVSYQVVHQSESLKSNAQIQTPTPPYIRLSVSENKIFKTGDTIPVYVYTNTGGMQTLENRLVINYESSSLSLAEADIKNNNIYPVTDIESVGNGKAIFSVFTKQEAGYNPIALAKEQKVAELDFHVTNPQTSKTEINLIINNGDDSTSITLFSPDASQTPTNITPNVQGVTISTE